MALTSFEEATAVTPVTSHTYSAIFPSDWCIGNVPHGGLITACILRTAALHFSSTLSSQRQPHCLALHLDFLRRTQTGPATLTVSDTKLGRQASVIHVALAQGGHTEVVGYITHSNLGAEKGVSVPTNFALAPVPAAVDLARLVRDEDANWGRATVPHVKFRKALLHADFHYPRAGPEAEREMNNGFADEWIRRADGGLWNRESLGYVIDIFPLLVERWLDWDVGRRGKDGAAAAARKEENRKGTKFWFPTLLLNLDVKKALPDEGIEWLFVRARAKQIRDGRMDLEIVVLDAQGELVALSHHICFVVGFERNTAVRKVEGRSKI